MRVFGVLLGFGVAFSVHGSAPFEVVEGLSKGADNVLLRDVDYSVLKSPEATQEDFDNLYWVNARGVGERTLNIAEYGEVLHYRENSFALMRLGDDQALALSGALHKEGMFCGVLIRLRGDTVAEKMAANPAPIAPIGSDLQEVVDGIASIKADNIEAAVDMLATINTRFHEEDSGQQVAGMLVSSYEAVAQDRDDITIMEYDHGDVTDQNSLLVRIEGQVYPDQVIVLGSHIDSINSDDHAGRAPGVDDNASGTATNLEIFRAIVDGGVYLQRTLEIHGYAAEEVGLYGSQDMATRYKNDGVNVIAMVQHDMNLYTSGADKIWLVTTDTNSSLNNQLMGLANQYLNIAIGKRFMFLGTSDHRSWTRQGYAASFPTENPFSYNLKIHTPNDTKANSGNFRQAASFAKLGLAYALHFAGVATE